MRRVARDYLHGKKAADIAISPMAPYAAKVWRNKLFKTIKALDVGAACFGGTVENGR
jgi:hypothetical protein